jgi:MFS family permease
VTLSAESVLRRYNAVSLAYALAGGFLAGGVYPVFLKSRGLNQLEINSVLAAYFVVMFLTDVPTGAFADALGRRLSFVLGCGLRCAAFALYFASYTYVLFLIAEAIDAIGTSFCNGAVDAWGVDALDHTGFSASKDHLFSRVSQFSSVGFMTTAIAGAYIATFDIAWPWIFGAAGYVVCGGLGALLRERVAAATRLDLARIPAAIATRIGQGMRRGFASRPVMLLSLAEAILLAALAPYWLEWPLFFGDSYGVGVGIVGVVFCVQSVSRMVGAEIVVRAGGVSRHRPLVLAGLVLVAGVSVAGAGALAATPSFALAALVLMNVALGAREPIALSWFNEHVAPEERATMLSFRSTLAMLGGSLGLLLGGYVVDLRGIPFHWRMAGAIVVLAAPCYFALRPRRSSC